MNIFLVGRDFSDYSYPEVICRMSVNNSSERGRGEGVTFFIASQEGHCGDLTQWEAVVYRNCLEAQEIYIFLD